MDDILQLILLIMPSIITGIILTLFNRRYDKKYREIDERTNVRKNESLLLLDMVMANGDLCYASTMALKRGSTNGEVEPAVDAYKEAKIKFMKFKDEQFIEHMQGL